MSTPGTPAPSSAPAAVGVANPAAGQTSTAGAANPAAAPAGQQSATPPRMMKVKFEGQEVEMPESEVLALASAGKVSTKRFQEAAAMKKQAEEVLKFAKDNPKEFFAKTGMNAREWAENYMMEELQNDAMSPEQRKARENEEKLRKYEDSEKRAKEKSRQDKIDALTNEKRQEFDVMFTKALNESGLPRTEFTVKRMAQLQLINIKKGLELNSTQLAKIVREDYANEQKSLLSAFDGDQLMEFLGPEAVKKLSKAQIAKLKARGVGPAGSGSRTNKPPQENTGLTWRELQKRNRKPL